MYWIPIISINSSQLHNDAFIGDGSSVWGQASWNVRLRNCCCGEYLSFHFVMCSNQWDFVLFVLWLSIKGLYYEKLYSISFWWVRLTVWNIGTNCFLKPFMPYPFGNVEKSLLDKENVVFIGNKCLLLACWHWSFLFPVDISISAGHKTQLI